MIEKVTDESLLSIIEQELMNASGDFLNSSDMARERQKATYEYGMMPLGHLTPQGVSQIVSSDTVEAIEGYTAIIAELMFNNEKIAKFIPSGQSPTSYHNARIAADLVNYEIFKKNRGWEILNTWVKSALLWKNSVLRWEFVEDHEYKFEDFEKISQENLDILLASPDIEIVGELKYEHELATNKETGEAEYAMTYHDVRLKRKINKTRVAIRNVTPESFRISKDASSLEDASFVGIQVDLTRSEIRKFYPDAADQIDWDTVGDGHQTWNMMYNEERSARKTLVGESFWNTGASHNVAEANRTLPVLECWLAIDRDGDGIAELKHFIIAGKTILLEEDTDCVQLASLCPFEVPHEFNGLSVADMIRPSTSATTAIMRGFIENVYLTNYAPKLADPNVVDFSALQNMKPKQLIATNGNPQQAVASLTPDTISQGTVPILELLQMHKEQATGLSKAAQGLNDTLYVSGNSEEKMQRAMSAAQIRIQYMARRFSETGFKRMVEGVYKVIREKMRNQTVGYFDQNDVYKEVDPAILPDNMLLRIDADVGENSNSSIVKKMTMVGQQLIPALQQAGAGAVVNPAAAVRVACKTLEALDLDPMDYLVDYTTPEFMQKAEQSRQGEQQAQEKMKQLEEQKTQLALAQAQATLDFTNTQAKNALQDNTKQFMVALDKSQQEWAKLYIAAAKEGVEPPKQRSVEELIAIATKFITEFTGKAPAEPSQMGGPAANLPEKPM